jgi:hypothetical protein
VTETQRNFIILAVIVVVVMTFTQAQVAVGLLSRLLSIVFTVFIGLALWQWYRRRESTINSLDGTARTVLQLSIIGLYAVFVTATVYPQWGMNGGLGTVAFFMLIALCGLGWYWAWNQKRSLW